jgi:soluble lytic murein transglycosylase-like protein
MNRAALLWGLGVAALVLPTISYPPVQRIARRATAPARGVRPPAPDKTPVSLRPFSSAFYEASARHGVPVSLLFAVSLQETRSSDPKAFRQEPVPSWVVTSETLNRARAAGWSNAALSASYGLMQLLGATAWGLGYRGTPGGLFEVKTNLEYGARYLAALLKKYASQTGRRELLALVHYNGGAGAVATLEAGRATPAALYAAQVLSRYQAITRGALTEASA